MPITQGESLAKNPKTCRRLSCRRITTVPIVINAINLKNVLRDIQTNCDNFIHGWLLSRGSLNTALWHIAMPVGEAIHSIMNDR